MDFTAIFDVVGEPATVALGALLIGLLFGIASQNNRFCLRSAVIDLTGTSSDGVRWQRLSLWLVVLGAAVAATQLVILAGLLDVEGVRQLTTARSLSGVLIGGALFGVGMSLTRGCVSRLTVLSANGNLRAVFSLAVFAAIAFATFNGALTPLRQAILGLWTLGPDASLNLLSDNGFGPQVGVAAGAAIVAVALLLRSSRHLPIGTLAWGLALGTTIAAGWWFTYTLSSQVFEPIAVGSISFTRPAIDVISFGAAGFPSSELGFGTGLLAGVLVGSFSAALFSGGLKIEWFDSIASAGRYAVGAALMGFGGVLAGGCSVGAGLTGGALFALAPLVALASMAGGSTLTELAMQYAKAGSEINRTKLAPAK